MNNSEVREAAPEGNGGVPQRVAVPDEKREAVLDEIWGLQAAAITQALKHGEPSAALLNVVTKWLGDQGVNWDAIKNRRKGGLPPELIGVLPFSGDDGETADDRGGNQ